MLAVVYHKSVSVAQSFLLGDLCSSYQHLSQNDLVFFLSLGDPSKSVLILGNDDDVSGRNWCNIAEGEDELILVNHCAWNLFADEFVEDRLLCHNYQ